MDERSKQLLAQCDCALTHAEKAERVADDAKVAAQLKIEEFYKHRWAITEGSLVLYRGDVFRMHCIDEHSLDSKPGRDERPWLQGYLRKKDGTFGTQLRRIYSEWEAM